MRRLFCILTMFTATLLGADVTGTWSGPMEMTREGETRADTAYLVLKQDGKVISGSVGPRAEKQLPISKGTVEGDEIYIEANVPERDAKMVLRLKVDGDKITGELSTEGTERQPMSGKMTLSKLQ